MVKRKLHEDPNLDFGLPVRNAVYEGGLDEMDARNFPKRSRKVFDGKVCNGRLVLISCTAVDCLDIAQVRLVPCL